jgi:hypothetical protein
MGMPALRFEFEEVSVEDRLTRLESSVEYIQSDVAEIKTDLRRLNDKLEGVDQKLSDKIDSVDQRLSAKIDALDQKFSDKFDSLKDSITTLTLSVEKTFSKFVIWAVTFYIGLAVTLLTVMAHNFHWM